MFYVFLIVIGIVAVAVYLLFFIRLVPGAAEERLGVIEPLPAELGVWKTDLESSDAKTAAAQGLQREVRFYFEENTGFFSQGRLLKQVRYRNLNTDAIDRVDPDQIVKRKRIRKK